MDEKAQYKTALRLAKRALDYIASYQTPPTPHAFEVFYTVCAGLNPKLNDAVAAIVAKNRKLTSADAERLHEEHIAMTTSTDQMQTVGSKMTTEMNGVLSLLGAAMQSTSSYQASLEQAEEHLGTDPSGQQASSMIQVLLNATQEMSRANSAVASNLEVSRAQIEDLDDCLKLLREETSKDGLTGLVTRKQLDLVLDETIAKSVASKSPFCLMIIDVDHFMAFNDVHGHVAGDSALRYVASCIKSNIKGPDTAGRYGGEEFAVILPDTELEHAMSLGERIRHLVNARQLVKKATGESMGRISVSIGITECDSGEIAEDCYDRADQCMYAAKEAGRNQVATKPIEAAAAMAETA